MLPFAFLFNIWCATNCLISFLHDFFFNYSGSGFNSLICFIKYAFSSLNCSSSERSLWNLDRKSTNLSWFRSRMSKIGLGLFGLATKTWKKKLKRDCRLKIRHRKSVEIFSSPKCTVINVLLKNNCNKFINAFVLWNF